MGCDIHLHVEVKHVDKGWLHYAHPKIERWYELFAKMAGVRNYDNDVEPLYPPRGLPNDISEVTRLCYEWEVDDAHSMSWLGRKEIAILNEFISKHPLNSKRSWEDFDTRCGYLFGNSLAFKDTDEYKPEWLKDCRVVFWFDN